MIPLKVSFLAKNTSKPYRISLKVSRRPTRQCGDSSQRHLQQQLCCTLIQNKSVWIGPWWTVYPQQTTPSKKTKTTKLGNDEGTCRKKICNLKACLRFVNRSLNKLWQRMETTWTVASGSFEWSVKSTKDDVQLNLAVIAWLEYDRKVMSQAVQMSRSELHMMLFTQFDHILTLGFLTRHDDAFWWWTVRICTAILTALGRWMSAEARFIAQCFSAIDQRSSD